jgi:heme/copper-type cytochrome/quinol oxidase subunit 1
VHTLVRRFIKTGIGFLGVGLALGIYMLAQRELFGGWPHPYLSSAHAHAVFFGFVVFVILGVALWLFPRAAKGDTRYRPELIAVAYWILTIATVVRLTGETWRVWVVAGWLGWTVLLAGLGQVVGLGVYFYTMWSRIRAVGSHVREAKGERF